MSYKYTIIQENKITKNKLTYEFAANDETEMVDEFYSFMRSVGFCESGYLTLVNDQDDSLYDDLESEVNKTYSNDVNPEMETYKNFEFSLEENINYDSCDDGQGQTEYTFTSSDADKIADKSESLASTWPFPLDRPSNETYRVDSLYETNGTKGYYGA